MNRRVLPPSSKQKAAFLCSVALKRLPLAFIALLIVLVSCGPAADDSDVSSEIRVAVASNFAKPMQELADHFEAETGYRVLVGKGASGKHYAQIVNGAPFDLFFSADADRPKRLESDGLIVAGSRFTYAEGALVLWSPVEGRGAGSSALLDQENLNHLAIANPRLAPYGHAAQQTLERLGRWDAFDGRLVRGENIAQTYQFVHSGSATAGFVALSQVIDVERGDIPSNAWLVPAEYYDPIEQQAVLLRDSHVAEAFLLFLRRNEGKAIVERYGYTVPPSRSGAAP